MTDILETPPQSIDLCHVDHDQLWPRTAVLPGKKHGATITYWSCPACPYYFTAITAAPKKVDMSNVTTLDQLQIVKALAKPTAIGLVIMANQHLTKLQVETIAADHGYPKITELREAMGRLQRQADDERMATAIHTGPTDASQQVGTRNKNLVSSARSNDAQMTRPAALGRPVQVSQGPRPYEPTAQLLLEARDSTSKRTIALAHKIEDLLIDLRDRLRDEKKQQQLREHQEAERRRLAAKAAAERDQLKADIAKAEEHLRELRAKARSKKVPVGRAKTLTSQSSESRRPGGTSQSDALRRRHAYYADFITRMGVPDATVRQWAADNGHQVGKFGLMGRAVLDAYEQAHPGQAAS